jgi:hypothetical protein
VSAVNHYENEYSDEPNLFVIELTPEFMAELETHYESVKFAWERNHNVNLIKADCGGMFLNEYYNFQNNRDGDFEFMQNNPFPEEKEDYSVRGHQISVFTDGGVCFSAYNKYSNETVESELTSVKQIKENYANSK